MMLNLRILSLILALVWPHVLAATQINICATCRVKSIADAIRSSNPGDTLIVHKGTYFEADLLIEKPLCIIGRGNPVIDARMKSEIMTVTADGVEITGLILRNVASSYTKDFAALRLKKCRKFNIHHNRFENVFFGIYLQNAHDGNIDDNIVTGNNMNEFNSGNGIHLWQCTLIRISGNTISRARDGIYLEFASNSEVNSNISIENKRYGLHFMFSNENSYADNIFRSNGAGVAVMFSKKIKMYRNQFLSNWGAASYGLLLKEIYDADIQHNVFKENSIGINAEGSNRINYFSNTFTANGWAVKILGACFENAFNRNNFISNSFDISYSGQINDNSFDGNYWSSYKGFDLNRDGYGDVPYRPVKLFTYVVNQTPESIILLRSFFVQLINLAEQVTPIFTPDNLMDHRPLMNPLVL